MRQYDNIYELQRQREYLSAQLEEATKELARLDLLNLTLTQQKRQATAAFHFIKVLQEKVEKALTTDDLYLNVVKALTSELSMDSAAVLRINFETRDISLLASAGLPEKLKGLKLDEDIATQQLLGPTFINSKSSLQSFHEFVRKSFRYPYFVWYPIADEEDGTVVLFVGNRVEDLVSKQPFSEISLETFGAISSVILLRRDSIAYTQEMLGKKEERIDFLAEILKSSPVSVIATDEDARIIYCNPAVEKLYGYKEQELIGRDPGMLNAESNADEIQSEILETVRRGQVWRGEILNRKKDGDLFYMRASIYKLLDKKGNFMAFVDFQEDVTERRRVEDALKESEEKYRTIFENTGTGTIIIEEDTTISLANKEFEKLTGYSKEEVEGKKSWREFVLKDDLERLKGYHDVRRIDPNGVPRNYELKFIDKHGNFRDVYLTVDVIPGTKKSVASSLDITERKWAEERLREYDARYSHLLDHLPDGVALTQRRRIIGVNPRMVQMFSYPSPESMEGLSLLDLASPGSGEIVRQQSTQRALGQQGENRFQFQGLRKDGSTFSAECTLTVDRSEAKAFVLAIIRDVTERKTYEEQRKLLSERIMTVQERDRASIARELHDELGQALTGIKMDMAWIKSHMKCTDEAVSDRFDALGNLVDTTIESVREMATSLHPSVLDQLGLAAAIEWYAGEFERRTGIECIIESESSDFNIDSNAPINLYRIFQEALTNIARHARASRVDVRIAEDQGGLTICISDNGRGIPSQKLSGPMSLGIAGMRERAELIKGRLDIQSRRGKGTTVTVQVPASL
jgi:PAS domain S-box-containing protein